MRAAWIAGEILQAYGETVKDLRLVPAAHGRFHIYFDGELVLQHGHNPHTWPEAKEVLGKLEEWRKAHP
ncbi:MAG: hypothetical protein HY535_08915 [Chloroflexi bacterium]|nr:hypothetical protein [Chloroflexota bacterium]